MGSGRPGSVGPGRLEGRASELWWRGAGVGVGLERRAFVGDGGGGLGGVWTFATESDCIVGLVVWDCRVNVQLGVDYGWLCFTRRRGDRGWKITSAP